MAKIGKILIRFKNQYIQALSDHIVNENLIFLNIQFFHIIREIHKFFEKKSIV
jgi:hypothetical protein